MATSFNILAWENPMDRRTWQAAVHELDTTEHTHTLACLYDTNLKISLVPSFGFRSHWLGRNNQQTFGFVFNGELDV